MVLDGTVEEDMKSSDVGKVDDSDDSDNGVTKLHAAVLASVNKSQLPKYCSLLRTRSEKGVGGCSATPNLPVIGEPLHGSYHALLPIQFDDGLKWLMKIPISGTRESFNESASNALTSEAQTMIYLRRNTSIPLPDVLTYDASLDNELGCPFIIITFIDGISLYDGWFDRSQAQDYCFRTNVLRDIATAMAQLGRFTFRSGGSLLFDDNGKPTTIGPMRCLDRKAMLDQMFAEDEEEDERIHYFDAGPFQQTGPFFTHFLDRETESQNPTQRGEIRLLRLFLSWIPEPEKSDDSFVLAHPDFDIQNFIVSHDGHLQAIIDWDGVVAVPRSLGFESYPGWLTRDWDPMMYGWTEDMERGVEPQGLREDSPSALADHRSQYAEYMRSALSQERARSTSTVADSDGGLSVSSRTINSLYTDNLFIASCDPACRFEILNKFVDTINNNLNRESRVAINIFDIIEVLEEGELDQAAQADLKASFQAVFR